MHGLFFLQQQQSTEDPTHIKKGTFINSHDAIILVDYSIKKQASPQHFSLGIMSHASLFWMWADTCITYLHMHHFGPSLRQFCVSNL
jgi:hypothetical protein